MGESAAGATGAAGFAVAGSAGLGAAGATGAGFGVSWAVEQAFKAIAAPAPRVNINCRRFISYFVPYASFGTRHILAVGLQS